jgi:hypothetical protein
VWLLGTTLSEVNKDAFNWSFRFCVPTAAQSADGDCVHAGTVSTGGIWRLAVPGGGLRVTSDDDGHFTPRVDAARDVAEATYCRAVASVNVRDATGDLVLTFGDGTVLEFLQVSSGYEAWHTIDAKGELFCCGGGKLEFLKARSENLP